MTNRIPIRTGLASIATLALLAACGQQPAAEAPSAAAPPAAAAAAAQAATSGITITNATARATPDGAVVAGGYLTIANAGAEADRLVSAASPRAGRMELHEMAMDGGMMTMRPVTGIDVPASGTVELKPGGLHLMFLDIPAPFRAGEAIPVTLTFEKAGAVEATLTVTEIAPGAGHGDGHGHDNSHGDGHDHDHGGATANGNR